MKRIENNRNAAEMIKRITKELFKIKVSFSFLGLLSLFLYFLLSLSYLEEKYRTVDSHVSEIIFMSLRVFLGCFLNLPEWL